MFDKQYRFTGTHAMMVEALTAVFDEDAKAKLFVRNLDVYINAPMVGLLLHRKGTKNTEGNTPDQNIFPEQMINNSDQLKYILRMILLLDTEYEANEEQRLDRAFRNFGNNEDDMSLFDSYVLGGVEVLYEKLISGVNDPNEYIDRMYDFVEDFHEKFNYDVNQESILKLCRASNKTK